MQTDSLGYAVIIRQSAATALAIDQKNQLYVAANQYYVGYRPDGSLFSREVGCLVQQFDSYGNLVREWPISASDGTFVGSMAVDRQQQVYLAGSFDYESTVGNQKLTARGINHIDAFVAKFTAEGVPKLAFSLPYDQLGPYRANGGGVAVDSSENFYVSGNFDHHSLAKYNAAGQLQWRRNVGHSPNSEWWLAPPLVQQGSIYLTGVSDDNLRAGTIDLTNLASGFRLFLVKYDASGQEGWAVQSRGTRLQPDNSTVADLTGDGAKSVFLVGYASAKPRFDTLAAVGPGRFNVLVVKVGANQVKITSKPGEGGNPGALPPISLYLGPDSTICEGESLVLKSPAEFAAYHWQNGTSDSTFRVTQAGIYWLTVRDRFGQTATDTVHVQPCLPLWIPNVLTPNGDEHNQRWVIKNLSSHQAHRVWVYDRWGKEVFESTNYHNEWEAEGLGNGLYFYVLQEDKSSRIYRGWVQVLR